MGGLALVAAAGALWAQSLAWQLEPILCNPPSQQHGNGPGRMLITLVETDAAHNKEQPGSQPPAWWLTRCRPQCYHLFLSCHRSSTLPHAQHCGTVLHSHTTSVHAAQQKQQQLLCALRRGESLTLPRAQSVLNPWMQLPTDNDMSNSSCMQDAVTL
jgi:hypothetical protein